MKYVFRNGGNFSSRHTKVAAESNWDKKDPYVGFHRTLSEAFDWFACVDQVDMTNLVGIECLMREYQLIEEMKVKGGDHASEEHAYFRGKQATLHGACVAPELTAWVAQRLKDNSEILKERRKAIEIQNLEPKAPPGRKK